MIKIKGLLGFAEQKFESTEEIYRAMAKFTMNDALVSQYIQSEIGRASCRERV